MNDLTEKLPETLDFLHEIHSILDSGQLRMAIPEGLKKLIPCDRISLVDVDQEANDGASIKSWPLPAYWSDLGEVYERYYHQHPVFSAITQDLKSVTFSQACQRFKWSDSPLYHEYFRKLKVKHQLSVPLSYATKDHMMAVGFNRADNDFCSEEGMLAEALAPHLALALHNAMLFDRLSLQLQDAQTDERLSSYLAVVEMRRRAFSHLPSGTAPLMAQFFGREIRAGDVLPESLYRWLIVQRNRCALSSQAVDFTVRGPDSRLMIRLLAHDASTSTLLINVDFPAPRMASRTALNKRKKLTRREREVLRWISEGKRNNEIAMILGVSARTIGKHVENILSKLNVSTRTAAARQASFILR